MNIVDRKLHTKWYQNRANEHLNHNSMEKCTAGMNCVYRLVSLAKELKEKENGTMPTKLCKQEIELNSEND